MVSELFVTVVYGDISCNDCQEVQSEPCERAPLYLDSHWHIKFMCEIAHISVIEKYDKKVMERLVYNHPHC